jgi:stage III sporulation protein AB
MAKFILGVAIVAFCSFCGYYMTKKYRKRQSFYLQLWEFNERFLSEVTYYRRPLAEFLSKYSYKNEFAVLLQSFYLGLEKGSFSLENICLDFLTEEDKKELEDYFGMLCKGDSTAQKAYFSGLKEVLAKKKMQSVEEGKKYGDLYVKLGFLIGLFLLVLMI